MAAVVTWGQWELGFLVPYWSLGACILFVLTRNFHLLFFSSLYNTHYPSPDARLLSACLSLQKYMHFSVDRKLQSTKWVVNFVHCNPHPVLSCGFSVQIYIIFILSSSWQNKRWNQRRGKKCRWRLLGSWKHRQSNTPSSCPWTGLLDPRDQQEKCSRLIINVEFLWAPN